MNLSLAHIKVVLTSTVTWLTSIAVVLPLIAGDLAKVLPTGAATAVGQDVIIAVAWIGTAVSIIRRVQPVLPEFRGILPPATSGSRGEDPAS